MHACMHDMLVIIEPPRTSSHINSLFICLFVFKWRAKQHECKQDNRNRIQGFRFRWFFFSLLVVVDVGFVPFHCKKDFHSDTIPIIRIKSNCNRPQFWLFVVVYSIYLIRKFAWNMRGELFWSLWCNGFDFDFDFLVSRRRPFHSNVSCYGFGHFESDRKIWNQTGNALMNANKKRNYVFLFMASHYWPNKMEGNAAKMKHPLFWFPRK